MTYHRVGDDIYPAFPGFHPRELTDVEYKRACERHGEEFVSRYYTSASAPEAAAPAETEMTDG